jgi:hypothetical protein
MSVRLRGQGIRKQILDDIFYPLSSDIHNEPVVEENFIQEEQEEQEEQENSNIETLTQENQEESSNVEVANYNEEITNYYEEEQIMNYIYE